eukprot:3835883-Rhodomonas_salina.1
MFSHILARLSQCLVPLFHSGPLALGRAKHKSDERSRTVLKDDSAREKLLAVGEATLSDALFRACNPKLQLQLVPPPATYPPGTGTPELGIPDVTVREPGPRSSSTCDPRPSPLAAVVPG